MIHIVASKVDNVTSKEWQVSLEGDAIPTMDELMEFLVKKYQALEATVIKKYSAHENNNFHNIKPKSRTMSHVANTGNKCLFCDNDHFITA